MQLSPSFVLLLLVAASALAQRYNNNRRQEVIQEWIRTIREAPKGHSMSPSWTSKSRPKVIGVGELPLQNEASGPASNVDSSPKSPFKFRNPFSGFTRSKRKPASTFVSKSEDHSRPRETFKQNSFNTDVKNSDLITRYHELESEKFQPLNPKKRPTVDLAPGPIIEEPSYPTLRPFGDSEYNGFDGFTRKPIERRPQIEDQRPQIVETERPFVQSQPAFGFDFPSFEQRPERIERPERPKRRPQENYIEEQRPKRLTRPKNFGFNPEEFDDRQFFRQPEFQDFQRPPRSRPQKRPIPTSTDFTISKPAFDFDQPSRPKRKFVKNFNSDFDDLALSGPPRRPSIFKQRPSNPGQRFPYRRNEFVEPPPNSDQGLRTTTPRPIPTPGPYDFPRPPPRRPRPPPTHPTHPPLITHPPEHYDHVTRLPPLLPSLESFNEVSDSKIRDYDYHQEEDYDKNYNVKEEQPSDGFFSYPGTFPSLEQLGAGFESMKLARSKRSLPEDPLQTSEFRIRYRRNRGRGGNRRRRKRPDRDQARQGFGFQSNFWDDSNVDSDDWYNNFPVQDFNQYNSYNDYTGQQRRDPYTEQTIQSYPADNQYYNDPYSTGYGDIVNNEILGSGNFEVVKGGTFYDQDTYYYSTYNRRPQYGEQFFENFRDFADIKQDRYRYNNEAGYDYPKY